MTTYRVVWEIDIEADDPRTAAREALRIQRDPRSIATVFNVTDTRFGHTNVIDTSDEEDPDDA